MTGEERRNKVIEYIEANQEPISGSMLARKLGVSRQVIVQDMALLRTAGYDIISTSKGYMLTLSHSQSPCRTFYVCHEDSQTEDELNLIVDGGGCVIDVFVEHGVYGEIRAQLNLNSRKKVKEFIENLHSGKVSPLKTLTDGFHYHTVKADSEKILDEIQEDLEKEGYLVK